MFHSFARHIYMKREKEKPKQIKANSFSYTNLPKHTYFHPSLSPFLVYPVCDWFWCMDRALLDLQLWVTFRLTPELEKQ